MFNNPFSMVVALIAIVAVASLIRARINPPPAAASEEVESLRAEIAALNARIARLEAQANTDR